MQILAATLRVLRREGAGVSTARIAAEAKCSKETIYSWFGDRGGLFAQLVLEQSAATNAALVKAIGAEDDGFEAVLTRFGMALLDLLTGEASIAIHRAAMAEATADSASLGAILQSSGGDDVSEIMVSMLENARSNGQVTYSDPKEALGTFVGLVMRDTQTRCLIGLDARPDGPEMQVLAEQAVDRFKKIYGPVAG